MSTTNTETKYQPCEICGDNNSVHDWCHGCPAVYCENCLQKINGYCRQCGYDIWKHKRRKVSKETSGNVMPTVPTRETFESGAVRDTTDYRYDLIPIQTLHLLLDFPHSNIRAQALISALSAYYTSEDEDVMTVLVNLSEFVKVQVSQLAHLYAQAMHEGAGKYGENNWRKGIPAPNLLNHALHHLFKLVSGDQSENHRSHLVWNVLTLIHFRLQEQQEGGHNEQNH